MASYAISPVSLSTSPLRGIFRLPPSKSQTLRALLFGALAQGASTIFSPLASPDTESMLRAISLLGAKVTQGKNFVRIEGVGGKLLSPEEVIDCGNSGIVLRFIGALAGLLPHYTILTGDVSIRKRRPVGPLVEGLRQLGVEAKGARLDDRPPLLIKGPFRSFQLKIDGSDSQPVSAFLIAGALSPKPLDLHVQNPGETPWIDVTLHWLNTLQIPYSREGYHTYRLAGCSLGASPFSSFSYTVPGDLSSLAFPLAASILLAEENQLLIKNVDLSDCQGDKILISILQSMGAEIYYDPVEHTLSCTKRGPLRGIEIDLNLCIDALPILAVLGCFCEGTTRLYNGEIARYKESDRIASIAVELKKMGALIQEHRDGLTISASSLHGASLQSHHDHRIALALSIAALKASSSSILEGTGCISKTIPAFLSDFQAIGAKIESIPSVIEESSLLCL